MATDLFSNFQLTDNSYDLDLAKQKLVSGDLVACGLPFLANPDLVRRFRQARRSKRLMRRLSIVGNNAGYADYPFFAGKEACAA